MKKYFSFPLFIIILFCFVTAQYENNINKLLSKGTTYYNKGDYSNAIIIYEDLLSEQEREYGNDDTQVAETLTRLGEMYSLIGMPDISVYYFNQATIIYKKSFQTRKELLEIPLLKLLKIYSFNKDTVMEQNTKNQLYSISALFQKFEKKQNDSTLTENKLFSPEEDSARNLMELGMSYINNGLFSEAALQFSRALNYKTENLDINFFDSFFSPDSIFRQNMINAFSFQAESDTSGAGYFFRALFHESGNQSFNNIQKYIQYAPTDIRGRLFYSNLFFNEGKWIDALFQYQQVLWLDSLNIDAHMGSALSLLYLGEHDDSMKEFTKVLKIDPYKYEAFYYLGLLQMNIEDYYNAIKNFTQALLLDPNNSDIYYNLGKAYFEDGKIIQAREAFTRTIGLFPQHGPALYYQGIINEDIMEIDAAVKAYSLAWEFS